MKRLSALLIAAALCLPLGGAEAWWQSVQQVAIGGASCPELVTNGGLTLNPINAAQSTTQNNGQWRINSGTGTVVWDGVSKVTLTGDGTHAAQFVMGPITTVPSTVYTYTVDIGVRAMTAFAGTSAFATTLLLTSGGPGVGTVFHFTASTTTTFIGIQVIPAASGTVTNLSVHCGMFWFFALFLAVPVNDNRRRYDKVAS